jgi:hypothetical protein
MTPNLSIDEVLLAIDNESISNSQLQDFMAGRDVCRDESVDLVDTS